MKEKSVADNPFAGGKTEDSIFWKSYREAMDPILLIGADNCVLDCNEAALLQLGLTDKAQIRGRTVGDFSPPRQPDGGPSVEKAAAYMENLLQHGRIRFEWMHKRDDGSLFEVETTSTVVTWQGRQIIYSQLRDISGQKRLLNKLRESEEASRRIFDEAADPVVMFTHGVVSDCNKAALQQLGHQHAHELLGQTPLDVAPPMQADGQPTAQLATKLIGEAMQSGNKSFEWLLQRKDGSIFEAEFTLTAMTVNGEDVLHIRWRDVSEQKRLARELRENEESFRRIFEEAAAPILLFKNGYFVDGNLAATRFLDYPDKQMFSGKTPLDLAPPRQPNGQSSADMVREMTLSAVRRGHHHFAWQMQRRDGSLVDTEITLTRITVRGELLIHAQIRDLTEQNRLQAALHAEKERAEITLASIGDAVITTDAEGRVTFLNHVASKLTGWAASEAIGRPTAEIFHIVNDNTRERVASPVDEALQKGKTVTLANHTVLIAHDGKEYNIEDSAAPIFLNDGSLLGCVLVFHDVSEKHELLKNVRWQAGHDVLTGLPNRVLLADRFQRALAASRRQKNLLGVCLMDLDQFKPVNDLYGHSAGDQLLIEVTRRMNVAVRNEDTVARLGGDEFALLLGNLADVPQLEMVLQRILAAVSAPYSIDGHTISISASIGVAIYPLDDADADTLLRHADQAMYLAKQAGRNRFHCFDVAYDRQAQTTQQTLTRVRAALHGNELRLQ
jgi:diguanylate cyclase (GGDEF)-like protein/PAS domain S-box-containing protein